MTRPCLLLLALVTVAGCDFSPSLDIETPAPVEAPVLRSVLRAGEPVRLRLSVSRDPYAPEAGESGLVERPTRVDARVTLWRDDREVETLAADPHTCYAQSASVCNVETGQTETTRSGPFECGAYQGRVVVEPGATYTLRAEVPGLPTAEATVAVPAYPAATGQGDASRLRLDLRDPPGAGDRYGLALLREFDRVQSSVCERGGRRDTLIALGYHVAYQSRFATRDPVLLAASLGAGASLRFATFPDDDFDGRARGFEISADPASVRFGDTGAFRLQVTALSPELYETYRILQAEGDKNPFAEPADLPSNVTGGYGRVGAVAVTEVRLPGPDG